MGKEQIEDKIKKLEEKRISAEKKVAYNKRQLKILEKGISPQLTRKARTNRLCTRAGMLESFIPHPELLSNDQIMELLEIAFRQKELQDALQEMVKSVVPEELHEDP